MMHGKVLRHGGAGMHTRIGTFQVEAGALDAVVDLFRHTVVPAFSRHEGFLGYQCFVDRERGRMVGLSFWASLRDLEASATTASEGLARAAKLAAVTVGEPQVLEQAFHAP